MKRHSHDIHVYKDADAMWLVTSNRRVLSRHWTQHVAVAHGARLARRLQVDLVIHARSGRFRSKDSYGNESARPDTEH